MRLSVFLSKTSRTLALTAACATAFAGPAASGQTVIQGDLAPVSLDFSAYTQDGIRAHQRQLSDRQNRIRDSRAPALPAFTSGLTMSNERKSIPLQLKSAPVPGKARLVPPSTIGRLNSYIRGDLHSDGRPGADSSLTTHDLTLGTDYRVSQRLLFGLAAGRMSTRSATGTALSAYMTVRPAERLYLDMSLSVGSHHARRGGSFGSALGSASGATFTSPSLTGQTRAFSLSVNHPRQFGSWTWQPYSRLDRVVTETEADDAGTAAVGATRDLAALSVGSTAETVWATPFGALRPMVLVEIQREVVAAGTVRPTTAETRSLVGFGLSTRVSRDVSAYAQSRYAQDGGEHLDRLVMLGVKFAF